jgi:multiple sugar transport system substrate-binding protein
MTRRSARSLRIAVRKLGAFERTIERQWADFCKSEKSDFELEILPFDIPDLHAALFEKEGLRRGDFDVAFVVTDWIAEAVVGQHLVDLQSYLKISPPEDYPGGWDDTLFRFQTYGNEVYGLPFHDGQKCLIYRKDLIDDPDERREYERRFGHPLRVPQTWNEFTQVARFFGRPQDPMSGVVFVASQDGYNTICDFWIHLWSRGGEIFDAQDHIRLDKPLVEETLDFYRKTVNDAGVMDATTRKLDATESSAVFARGEAAMMVNWYSCAAQCEALPESKVKGKIGVGHFPKEDRQRGFTLNVYWILGVASGSENKDLAYRFTKHCASKKMDRLLTLEGGNGSRLSTWQDEQLNQLIPFYRELEALQRGACDMPRHPEWSRLGTVIDGMMREAIATDRPVGDIARDGQSRAEKILKQEQEA